MTEIRGKLQVKGSTRVTDLRVLDASSREVAVGINRLELELDPGIYLVQAAIPGDRVERLVAVEPGSASLVNDLDLHYDSPVPLIAVRSAHKYQREAAARCSINAPITLGDLASARLFIFARTIKGDSRLECPNFVVRSQGSSISFPDFGEFDLNEGWIALTMNLRPGTYMLEQEIPGLGKRCQPLFVEEGWETQVFAPWDGFPDFARATIYMRHKGSGFDPTRVRDYERIDVAINGLAQDRLLITTRDLNTFLREKFENPLLGLIACYALLDQSNVDYRRLERIINNLQNLLPHSPDVALISLLLKMREQQLPSSGEGDLLSLELPTFVTPPLLAKGTELLMRLAATYEKLCLADSWLAGVAIRLTTGSTWTRWDSTTSVTDALKHLQMNLQRLHEEEPNLSVSDFAQRLMLPLSVVSKEAQANLVLETKSTTALISNISSLPRVAETKRKAPDFKKVFVISEQNNTVKNELFAFLRALGLSPIEHEQVMPLTGEASPSIGAILRTAFDVAQAVLILLIGVDEARLQSDYQTQYDPDYEKNLTAQARLNVIFEAGMVFSMQPNRTILIELGPLGPFSNAVGYRTVRLNNEPERRQRLALMLKGAGCDVDFSSNDWLSAGNLSLSNIA